MKGKNVLMFSHVANLSGAPIILANIAKYLPKFGYNPILVLLDGGGLENTLKLWSIPYIILKKPFKPLNFLKIILNYRPSIIHINTIVKGWPVLVSRMLFKTIVWHIHEYLDNKRIYAKILHFFSTAVILVSNDQFNLFKEMKNSFYIQNGIDLSLYRNVKPLEEIEELRKQGNLIVTYVGSIEPRKGLLILAKAAKLLKDDSMIKFVIVGEIYNNSYFKEIKEFIESNNIINNFLFLGERNDVPSILSASDILCHPAFIEVFGLVILEAMASGIPVIASNIGEISRVIKNNKTGYLVSPGDFSKIAKKIKYLKDNVDFRRRMGDIAKKEVEKYDIKKQVRKIVEVYKKIGK